MFRSLNEDIFKYKEIDFDKSGDTGSATIVFEQGVVQNDEEFMVCVTAFDDEGSMESWCKIATNHPEPQPARRSLHLGQVKVYSYNLYLHNVIR